MVGVGGVIAGAGLGRAVVKGGGVMTAAGAGGVIAGAGLGRAVVKDGGVMTVAFGGTLIEAAEGRFVKTEACGEGGGDKKLVIDNRAGSSRIDCVGEEILGIAAAPEGGGCGGGGGGSMSGS